MKRHLSVRREGNVQVGEIFEFVKSIRVMLTSFSRLALPARGYQ